jgi:hypothetical protein
MVDDGSKTEFEIVSKEGWESSMKMLDLFRNSSYVIFM